MTLTITHNSVVTVPDDFNYPVGSDEWNSAHTVSGTLTSANGGTGLTLATTNLDFYVATTGSDGAAGTIGAPFLTPQKALDVAASYDYQNLYTVTVHVADGTYTRSDGNPTILPFLVNYPNNQFSVFTGNTTTPTNCLLHNTVSDCVKPAAYCSSWEMTGFQTKADNGVSVRDIRADYYSSLIIDKIDFAGSGILCSAGNFSFILCIGSTLSISSTSFHYALEGFFYGAIINDSSVTTITNPATVSSFVSCGDHSIIGSGTFVNPGNITGDSIDLFNYGSWESTVPRASLPGGGGVLFLDWTSKYWGDPESVIYDIGGNAILQPDGALRIGDTELDISPFGLNTLFQAVQSNFGPHGSNLGFIFARFDSATAANSGTIGYLRSRSATPGSFIAVQTGDTLGELDFWADGGSNYNNVAASIVVTATGTIGAATVPGRVSLRACAQGDQFASEVLALDGVLRAAQITGSLGRGAPTTHTADFSVGTAENWIINNKSGSSCVVTLPAAATFPGREIMLNNYQAQTVVSATTNVVPLAGGAASTAIIAGTAGKWATLVSDATNWLIMQSN